MTTTIDESNTTRSASPMGRKVLKILNEQIEIRMIALLVIIVFALSLMSSHFLTINNVLNMLDQAVVVGFVALGMTLVILIGGIDLSVGSLVGVMGILLATIMPSVGLFPALALTIIAGAAFGYVNAAVITYGGIAPFVVTLGMMSIARSVAYVVSDGNSLGGIPESLAWVATADIAGIPVNFALLVLAYAVTWWFLTYSKGGRTLYAVGSNAEAARISGLNVRFWSVLTYVVTGVTCAVASIFLAARLLSVDPVAGEGLELDTIAAVVIGGASLFGGRGSIIGTLCGVMIMVFIRNALNLLNVSPYWQGFAIGTILVAAVLVERIMSRKST